MTESKARSEANPPASPEAAEGAPTSGAQSGEPASDAPVIQLPIFEGPLDLLLHLIQQHELDILDIPVAFITQKYLEYLNTMRALSIDVASEYLVMAATLAHIKSKMLLPSVPAGQEDDGEAAAEADPRAELVRRLLEYQKYKAAAEELGERGTLLGKDVFMRGTSEPVPEGPAPFAPTPIFSLLDAFERVLKRANVRIDHEVVFDRISITDRIVELTEKLQGRRSMAFEEFFFDPAKVDPKTGEPIAPSRFELVVTFLAILEMCKLRLIRVYQSGSLETIHVELAVEGARVNPLDDDAEGEAAPEVDAPEREELKADDFALNEGDGEALPGGEPEARGSEEPGGLDADEVAPGYEDPEPVETSAESERALGHDDPEPREETIADEVRANDEPGSVGDLADEPSTGGLGASGPAELGAEEEDDLLPAGGEEDHDPAARSDHEAPGASELPRDEVMDDD